MRKKYTIKSFQNWLNVALLKASLLQIFVQLNLVSIQQNVID